MMRMGGDSAAECAGGYGEMECDLSWACGGSCSCQFDYDDYRDCAYNEPTACNQFAHYDYSPSSDYGCDGTWYFKSFHPRHHHSYLHSTSSTSSASSSDEMDSAVVEAVLSLEWDLAARQTSLTDLTPVRAVRGIQNYAQMCSPDGADSIQSNDEVLTAQLSPDAQIPTTVDDVTCDDGDKSLASQSSNASPNDSNKSLPPTQPAKKRRRRQKQLWHFLMDTLNDARYCPSIIEWLERDDGMFRFVEPRLVAQLWGQRRRRAGMTYEHLSRAMRYYYKQGVMKRVGDHGRLVYQFLTNSENLKPQRVTIK